ncbi:endonuclease/exonuclease/phosphatase family protein [Planctomicrobium sp. SH668]|uniref:endonuclease/exonuclease/phosphatase family protein n=1 Tax=Planctomicrobium sp. SH668 TaxID=3448126 RepID=UPI003F5C590E
MHFSSILIRACFVAAFSIGAIGTVTAADKSEVRVMSFNIRYGSAQDGQDSWDHRKDFLVETIKKYSPDLLGTQETLAFQMKFISDNLPGYTAFGVGREDGDKKGEMTAIFYRTDRFTKLDGGHFWLSETPDQPGSKSWDSSLPRMVSWLKLKDNVAPNNPVIYFANTHFDHRGQTARLESAKLIRQRVEVLPAGSRVIVTGDFNATSDDPPYAAIFGEVNGKKSVRDAYRIANPKVLENEATFQGFQLGREIGKSIDWVGVTPGFSVKSAVINRVSKDKRYPSDHFPIEVILKYAE